MGTDIHAGIEYKDATGWHAVTSPNKYYGKYPGEPKESARLDLDRNYDLFAILADVRNGSGFAGIKTGDGFEIISKPKGLPEDADPVTLETACTGDHSDTWITLQEILDFDWTRTTRHTGVVDATQFEKWDRMKEYIPGPASYAGDVSGSKIKHISNEEMRAHIQDVFGGNRYGQERNACLSKLDNNLVTRLEWESGYTETTTQVWEKILPTMLKLGKEYGYNNVRLVMNFDS